MNSGLKHFLKVLFVYLITFSNVIGQIPKYNEDAPYKFIDSVKKVFEIDEDNIDESKNRVVANTSKETYYFRIDKERNNSLKIEMKRDEQLISLKRNSSYYYVYNTNENSSAGKIYVSPSNKKLVTNKANLTTGACASTYSESIFHTDSKTCSVYIPFYSRGEFKHIQFNKNYYDSKYLTIIPIKRPYACVNRKLKFIIPKWAEVDLKTFNFEGYNIKKTEREVLLPVNKINKPFTIIEFTIDQLPAFISEPSSPGFSYYSPHIVFIPKNYTHNSTKHKIFNSTDDQYAWYRRLINQVDNDKSKLESLVNDLTKDATTDIEKVENIYYWIQDNIRYIAFENGIMGFQPESCDKVYDKKYGDCKGVANLAKNMLQIANFDGRVAWIGTNSINPKYDYSFPSLSTDNHMICALFLNDTIYYIDPTEKFIELGDYATRIQGRHVMIEDGNNYMIKKVPEFDNKRNSITKNRVISIEDGVLKGHAKYHYNGEGKTGIMSIYHNLRNTDKENGLINFLKNGDDAISISNNKSPDFKERSGSLVFDFDFEMKNKVIEVDKELYMNFDIDMEMSDLNIDSTRQTDYVIGYKHNLEISTSINIPEGYNVSYHPKSFAISTNSFSIQVDFIIADGQIKYLKNLSTYQDRIPKQDFDKWNEAIDKLNQIYKDTIILKSE